MPESKSLELILNRIDQLDDKFSTKFNHIAHRLDVVDDRLDRVDSSFDSIDDKFIEVDSRFDSIEDKFIEVDIRFDSIEDKFDKVDDKLGLIYDQTVRLTLGQTALKTDIDEIKTVYNYLNNEVARNSKDIYVIKNKKN